MVSKQQTYTDYYAILDVDPTSSIQEIKRSFRKKVKEQHPDLRKATLDSQKGIRILIQAYKTLSNPESRAEYDRTHWFFRRSGIEFDYRSFLRSRSDDPASQAKLIFFDLLHENEGDAVALHERLSADEGFDLELHLDREDFMDCAYLLAEEYEKLGKYDREFELLQRIAACEIEKPYFRHFFYEVERRLQSLVFFKMQGFADPAYHIQCLTALAGLGFPKKFTAQLYKKSAEICLNLSNYREAVDFLEKGLKLDGRLAGASKLKERLAKKSEQAGASDAAGY